MCKPIRDHQQLGLARRRQLLLLLPWLCLAPSLSVAQAAAADKDAEDSVPSLIGLETEGVESTCRLESFYVVDANSLAKRAKVPLCSVDKMLSVSTLNGQVFLKGSQESELHNASAMHFFGTYAAPWFLYQAIADSPYETRDTETAGLFYVNDYCYYMWWLAAAQSKDKAQESPGTYLIKIYKELEKMKPWRRRNGTDFVFFFPWSIAHVLDYEHSRPDGGVLQAYLDIVCNQLHRGIHITVENLQGKNLCKHGLPRQAETIVAPFVPNVIDVKGQALMESLSSMQRHVHGLENRTTLLHFKGRCTHHSQNPGAQLRSRVAAAMADEAEDVHVRCVEREQGGILPFEHLLMEMERSQFCLVLPDMGLSARLLSEVMLAGCIPVFLGPPFAAMPFDQDLDYSLFSLILYLEDHKDWTQSPARRQAGEKEESGSTKLELQYHADATEDLIYDNKLSSAKEVVSFLRQIPKEVIVEGLEEVHKVRRSFLFHPELDHDNPSAVDLLTLNLCRQMNHLANTQPLPATGLRRLLRTGGGWQQAPNLSRSEPQSSAQEGQAWKAKLKALR